MEMSKKKVRPDRQVENFFPDTMQWEKQNIGSLKLLQMAFSYQQNKLLEFFRNDNGYL